LLWLEPDHPIVVGRLAGIFLCALPAVRELYQYIHDPRFNGFTASEQSDLQQLSQASRKDGPARLAFNCNHSN